MRRAVKVKSTPQVPLRKAASTASSASRRAFPAWIAADEGAVAFSAAPVSPRIRTALVLRLVNQPKSAKSKGASDGRAAR
jgi:hypothetical protein